MFCTSRPPLHNNKLTVWQMIGSTVLLIYLHVRRLAGSNFHSWWLVDLCLSWWYSLQY